MLAVFAATFTQAQSFKPGRTYVAGDSDKYVLKLNATTEMGDIAVTANATLTVKKVYDNGDADIESTTSNMKLNFGGNEIEPPSMPEPITTKYNKYGLALTKAGSRGVSLGRFGSYFGEKELKVGETFTFDNADEKNPKIHTKGSAKLVSVEGGKATLAVVIDNYTEGNEQPMHLDGKVVVDAATSKMLHFEGNATNIPAEGNGPAISKADFKMDRQ